MVKGILVGGDFSDLVVRQKEQDHFEIGELLIAEDSKQKVLLQVFDLKYGSQVSTQHLELMGGLALENSQAAVFFDPSLRNYTMAHLKALVCIKSSQIGKAKGLPEFFTTVREPTVADLQFLGKPENPLFLGKLRSGSRVIEFPLYINGKEAFSHHVLIAATTGRGKSNLLKCLLWDLVDEQYCGVLVLDPHDEYYRQALSSHPSKHKVHQYSTNTTPGGQTLRFNISLLRPQHFNGAIDWTDAQRQAVTQYYKEFGDSWIESIVLEKEPKGNFHEGTLAVVRRRILQVLGLDNDHGTVVSDGLFVTTGGLNTVNDICNQLEKGETVIIDTSTFDGSSEILLGSIVASEILNRYRRYNREGTLASKPVISIILEEAPRVLGKEVLEQGPNIFSTIAREGRKFKVGLTAITQLPSLIPREVLANMNTKIILGMEMKPERQAMIESASQDLSTDDRAIASLDKGEAIVTSTFVPFALPIRIPRFEEFCKPSTRGVTPQGATIPIAKSFGGVKLG